MMTVPRAVDETADLELIARVIAGSESARATLYDRFADRVYSVVRRLADDDATGEDWAQDAWRRIFDGLEGFEGRSSLAAWIHRVAINTALNGRRRVRRFTYATLPETLVEPRQEQDSLREQLESAIRRLPTGMRRVLVLHDVEGYGHDEIARMLGTSESNSRSQLYRARAKARAWLMEEDR